jgi:hypothetical protein
MEQTAFTTEDTNSRFLQVRADLLEIFDWDLAVAAVCQILCVRDRKVYARMTRGGQDGERWFVMTTDEIYNWGLAVVGTTYIDQALAKLESMGVVSVRRSRRVYAPREIKLETAVLNQMLRGIEGQEIETPEPRKTPKRARKYHNIKTPVTESLPQNCDTTPSSLWDGTAKSLPQNCGLKDKTIGRRKEIEEIKENGSLSSPASKGTKAGTLNAAEGREETISQAYKIPSGDQREQPQEPCQPRNAFSESGTNTYDGTTVRESSTKTSEPNTYVCEDNVKFEQTPIPPHSPSLTPCPQQPTNSLPRVMDEALDTEAGGPMDFRWFSGSYLRNCKMPFGTPKDKKVKKPTGLDKKRVEDFLDRTQLGGSYIERCLEGYGNSDWGKKHGFPIAGFVKDPESWLNYAPAGATEAQDETEAPRTSQDTPRSNTEAPGVKKWDAATAWNEQVRFAPHVGIDIGKNRRYSTVTSDMEFQSAFPQIVAKADALHELCGPEVDWLKFTWVIDTKPGELEPNWKKLVSGRMDFILKRKQPEKSMFQQAADESLQRLLKKYGHAVA